MPPLWKVKPSVDNPAAGIWVGPGANSSTDGLWLGSLGELTTGKQPRVYLSTSKEQVVAVVGKRGSGKSFTLGVIAEGLSLSSDSSAISVQHRRRATLLFDPLDVYWTTKFGVAPSNNAEANRHYEMAKALKATQLLCHGDSELIVYQLQGRYRIKDANLKILADKVKAAASTLEKITWKQVPREHPMISRADKLLNQALNRSGAKAPYKETRSMPPQGEFFR